MHEEIFLQRAIGVPTRNWYVAVLRLFFFLKDFRTIFLFSYCSCLIFDGLLTTLRLLDYILPCSEHAEWCFSYLRFAYQIYDTEFVFLMLSIVQNAGSPWCEVRLLFIYHPLNPCCVVRSSENIINKLKMVD